MSFFFINSKNSFEGQLTGEKTVLATRKHWFALFFPFWAALFLAFIPFLIYFFIQDFGWYGIISSLFWFSVIIYYLILWLLLFYQIMLYILTVTIVTNKRIIRINQKAFFIYERNEMELNKVQDVSVKVEGIFAAFLNFGDLEVQTAGAIVKFTFPQLPNPEKIKEIIMRSSLNPLSSRVDFFSKEKNHENSRISCEKCDCSEI